MPGSSKPGDSAEPATNTNAATANRAQPNSHRGSTNSTESDWNGSGLDTAKSHMLHSPHDAAECPGPARTLRHSYEKAGPTMAAYSEAKKRATLKKLRENDGNVSKTSRETGVSKSTVGNWGREAGVTSAARATTKASTEDYAQRARESRERLNAALAADAEKLREQLWLETEYVHVTKDGDVVRYRLPEPTHQDKRHLAGAIRMLTTTTMDIERHGRGGDAGASLIADLVDGIYASLKGGRDG